MNSLEKQWIIIQAYKHNGELHRQWSHSYVLEDNEDYVILASVFASVIESDGRTWHTKEPAIFILSKKEWFNVIAMLKEDGVCFYVNIASPTIFDKGFLKYIDYDLDLKLYPNKDIRLIDVKEYGYHRKKYNYGDDIDKILRFNITNIKECMGKNEFPFCDDLIRKYYHDFIELTKKEK